MAQLSTQSQVTAHNNSLTHNLGQIKEKYSDIFEGLGTFLGEPYHIQLDPSVPPVHVPCRPVPIHQQEEFKHPLTDMEKAGMIVPVHEATAWISSFVIVETSKDTNKKTGAQHPHPKTKMRVCLDPSNLNKATTREPYYYRTTEDVIPELHTAKYFTIIRHEIWILANSIG